MADGMDSQLPRVVVAGSATDEKQTQTAAAAASAAAAAALAESQPASAARETMEWDYGVGLWSETTDWTDDRVILIETNYREVRAEGVATPSEAWGLNKAVRPKRRCDRRIASHSLRRESAGEAMGPSQGSKRPCTPLIGGSSGPAVGLAVGPKFAPTDDAHQAAFNLSLEPLLCDPPEGSDWSSGVARLSVSDDGARKCAAHLQRAWVGGRLRLEDGKTCFGCVGTDQMLLLRTAHRRHCVRGARASPRMSDAR